MHSSWEWPESFLPLLLRDGFIQPLQFLIVSYQKLGALTKTHLEIKNKSAKCKRAPSTPNNSKLLLAIRWKQRKMDMTHSQSLSSPESYTAAPQLITRYSNTASYKTEHSSRWHQDPVTDSFTETCSKTLSQGTRRNRRGMGQSPPERPPKTVLPTAGGLPATWQPQPPSSQREGGQREGPRPRPP